MLRQTKWFISLGFLLICFLASLIPWSFNDGYVSVTVLQGKMMSCCFTYNKADLYTSTLLCVNEYNHWRSIWAWWISFGHHFIWVCVCLPVSMYVCPRVWVCECVCECVCVWVCMCVQCVCAVASIHLKSRCGNRAFLQCQLCITD